MKVFFIFLLLLVPLMAGAGIYRFVDDAGNVTYSDIPGPGAKPAQLPGLSTYEAPVYRSLTPRETEGESSDAVFQYRVEILEPESNENVRADGGLVKVKIDIEPTLRAGVNRVLYRLDDDKPRSTTSERIYLHNISRGPHTLTVWIADKQTNVVSQKKSVGFFLSRASDLFQRNAVGSAGPGVMRAPNVRGTRPNRRPNIPRQYTPRSVPSTSQPLPPPNPSGAIPIHQGN